MKRQYSTSLFLIILVLIATGAFVAHPDMWRSVVHLVTLKRITELQTFVQKLGVWGPILVILLMIFHSVTFVPSEVITITAVVLFGPVLGVVYAWIGSMLGAYLSFFLARGFGRPIVDRFVPKRLLDRFDMFFEHEGLKGIFILRLIPLVSFNALNYASGLTNMTFWDFTWTTGLGILPAGILVALLYQSTVGEKYAFVGLTIVGLALLVGLVVRSRLQRKYGVLPERKE